MFVELKRLFDHHSELEAAFFVHMVGKPDSDIAAYALFLAIRSAQIHHDHAKVLANINDLLARLPAAATREDREYLAGLKAECDLALSPLPTQR